MKRILTLLLLFLLPNQYSLSHELVQSIPDCLKKNEQQEDFILPNIFIYSDPQEDSTIEKKSNTFEDTNKKQDKKVNQTSKKSDENIRYDDSSVARYDFTIDNEDVVELSDIHFKSLNLDSHNSNSIFKLDIAKQNFAQRSVMPYTYQKEEYNILPLSKNQVEEFGNFKFGTLYNIGIDTSQLEYNAGLFTRYERNRFAISTAYQKNQMTTYGLTTDNFYLSPKFKLNDMISISSIIKADTTRNRKSNEFVLTIRPFAHKGNERVNLEFGAGQTYDANNELFKTQFRFNTRIKL